MVMTPKENTFDRHVSNMLDINKKYKIQLQACTFTKTFIFTIHWQFTC